MANQATAVDLGGVASKVISGNPATLRGFWVVTSGAATVTIYDNTSASGTVLAQWTTAGAADKEFAWPDGLRCTTGVFIVASAGTLTGQVAIG